MAERKSAWDHLMAAFSVALVVGAVLTFFMMARIKIRGPGAKGPACTVSCPHCGRRIVVTLEKEIKDGQATR